MARTFKTQAHFRSDAETLLYAAEYHLANRGFKILSKSSNSLEAEGPGLNSTRQDPILGASLIRLSSAGESLQLEAELGGAASLEKFIRWFPLLLTISLFALCAVTLLLLLPVANFAWLSFIPLLATLTWLVLAPMIGASIRKRTEVALNTFLHNLSQTSLGPFRMVPAIK